MAERLRRGEKVFFEGLYLGAERSGAPIACMDCAFDHKCSLDLTTLCCMVDDIVNHEYYHMKILY